MPTMELGQVRPVQRGMWDADVANYKGYDWVLYKGSAWLALKNVPAGYEPDSQPEFWTLFGARGEAGPRGEQGPQGVPGKAGVDGKNGMDGAQGPEGERGNDGECGPRGEQGPQGLPGKAGADGVDGAQGPVGPARKDGERGPQGEQGPQGLPGQQGPAVPLSNSVTSTSQTDAASSLAVKTAYDKAVASQERADAAYAKAGQAQTAIVDIAHGGTGKSTAAEGLAELGGRSAELPWVTTSLHNNFTFSAATTSIIPFTADFGDTEHFSSGIYTCPRAGLVAVSAMCRLYHPNGIGGSSLNLYRQRGGVNGAICESNPDYVAGSRPFFPAVMSAIVPVQPGDRLFLIGYMPVAAQMMNAELMSSSGVRHIHTFSLAYIQ